MAERPRELGDFKKARVNGGTNNHPLKDSHKCRLRRYERKSVEVGVFRRGWVTLNADFRGKGASPIKHSWYQSSRVIALSCGIKISAVHHLVLPQSTCVTDGRTDRITTPKTALAYARTVKMAAIMSRINSHTLTGTSPNRSPQS